MKLNKNHLSKITNIIFWLLLIGAIVQRVPMWIQQHQLSGKILKPAPVRNALGTEMALPASDHKASLLVFWATWCGPCKIELGRLKKAVEDKELDGSRIFLISSGEEPKLIEQTLKEKAYPFSSYDDFSGRLANELGVVATPTLVFVNDELQISDITTGISPLSVWRAKKYIGLK